MKRLLLTLGLLLSANVSAEFDIGLKCSSDEESLVFADDLQKHWILIDREAKKVRVFTIKTLNSEPFGYWTETYELGETAGNYLWNNRGLVRGGSTYWRLNRETLVFQTISEYSPDFFPCELSEPKEVKREIDFQKKEKTRREEEKKLNKELQDAEQLKKNKI
jgi:hypothetical protein